MKKVVIGLALLMFFSGCTAVKTGHFDQSDLSKILTTNWQNFKNGKTDFKGGLAMQVLSSKGDYFMSADMGDKMSNMTHFRTASVTKTFTASAIMLLQQRGLLNIDDKITDNMPGTNNPYLPDKPEFNIPYKKDITIRELLMHRAGVFDVANNEIPDNEFSHNQPYVNQDYLQYVEATDPNHTFTPDELIGVVATNQVSFFVPGSAYHYSDTGYTILGKIIEQVSAKSYGEFVKSELLTPNSLNSTTLPSKGDEQTLPDPFVAGFRWSNNVSEDVTISNMSPHIAEGNMTTTPLDLANWGKKLYTGQAGLTQQTVTMMEQGMDKGDGSGNKYGLGMDVSTDGTFGHSGAHAGYLTLLNYNPATNVTYVMFSSVWDCQTCSQSINSVLDQFKMMMSTANDITKKMGY